MRIVTTSEAADKPASKQARIIHHLKTRMLTGEMRPGDRLPTRQALIAAYGVCMVTLQRAMDILRDDGFIVTRGRLGSFVADAPPHLCRYGLVFPCVTTEQQVSGPRLAHLEPPSRFMDAMAQVAMAYADDPAQELICYMAVDRELNTPGYQRLVRDIQARRLAGLIFLHPNSSYTPGLLAGTGIPSIAYGYGHSLPGSPIFQTDHRAFIDRALDFLVAQGRRRIAMLTIAVPGDDMEAHFHQAAAARGLRTGIASVLGLEPQYPWWARNAVALMLNQDPALRPDGLIISDDHLVPSGTHAVLEARIAVPDALMVVAHCNFVSNAPSAVRVTRLGFDVAGILRTCLDRLAAQRRGEPVPPVTRIAPVFAPETDPRPPHKMARRLAHSR